MLHLEQANSYSALRAEAASNDVEDAEGAPENLRPLAESPPEAGQLKGRWHFETPSLAQKKC